MKKIKKYLEFINESKKEEMSTRKNVKSGDFDLSIDISPYESSQFGQNKHKVYLSKNGITYYLGDLRKWSSGESLSYLRLDKIREIDPIDYRNLDDNELEIVNGELDRVVIEDNLMSEPRTYREKIEEEL